MDTEENENLAETLEENVQNDFKYIPYFEFKRIRPNNVKSDNNGLNEIVFKVPKKRSGHRAVCNDENLWARTT